MINTQTQYERDEPRIVVNVTSQVLSQEANSYSFLPVGLRAES
jgi:hypothetical protein